MPKVIVFPSPFGSGCCVTTPASGVSVTSLVIPSGGVVKDTSSLPNTPPSSWTIDSLGDIIVRDVTDWTILSSQFWGMLTPSEKLSIAGSNDPQVALLRFEFQLNPTISNTNPQLLSGLSNLISTGLLTQARVTQLLGPLTSGLTSIGLPL